MKSCFVVVIVIFFIIKKTQRYSFNVLCLSLFCRTCDGCTLDKECGFCFLDPRSGPTNGSCVPVQHKERGVIDRAAFGPCHGPEPGAATWAYSFCPTRLSWIVTLGLALYLACFSSGKTFISPTLTRELLIFTFIYLFTNYFKYNYEQF